MIRQATAPLLLLSLVQLLSSSVLGLDPDGALLMSFRYSVAGDPFSVLGGWDDSDATPCSWNGVMCTTIASADAVTAPRVISLVLPDAQLLGPIPPGLGLIEHLRHLDLAGNSLNGTLPATLFSAPELRVISLAGNQISGQLPEVSGGMKSLTHLNLSYNRITGGIPPGLGSGIPANATVDLSFNHLTGEIPESGAFLSQKPQYFAGNPDLCGLPLKDLCPAPQPPPTPSNPPATDVSSAGPPPPPPPPPSPSMSPPAFAVIPKGQNGDAPPPANGGRGGLSPAAIAAIIVGDMGGIGLLFMLLLYVFHVKRRRAQQLQRRQETRTIGVKGESSSETRELGAFACCSRNKCGCGDGGGGSGETSEETDEDDDDEESGRAAEPLKQQGAALVMVDGEMELEMETLLRASAYVLGSAADSNVVYKAVLEDGTALAVRRIGERRSMDKLKDFEAQVRSVAKLRHPNLLRVRGFYWGPDEKLLISDYAPNGSLLNISFTKKLGTSPYHLTWAVRVRIARGVARGLAFLHDKKCIHGNLKPSNILLSPNMEPWIADFGLERLVVGDKSSRPGTSARHFGSKRSALSSQPGAPELSPTVGATAAPSPVGSSSAFTSLYQAPESLQNLKPNPKWDVFSFGTLLLELLAGRVFSESEVSEWNAGFVVDEGTQVLRMADPAIRGELQGREEALLSCFKLGFCCASFAPQRRPSMKEALQVLDRILYSLSP